MGLLKNKNILILIIVIMIGNSLQAFNDTVLISCENTVPTTATDCTSLSDTYVSCCYLENTTTPPSWGKKLCMPIRPQTTPYNFVKIIFGIGYTMDCTPPAATIPFDIYPETAEKYSRCGPKRPETIDDCKPYSLTDNSCCMANYLVDYLSISVNECFYFGSLYNQNIRDELGLNATIRIGQAYIQCNKKFIRISLLSLVFVIVFFLILI